MHVRVVVVPTKLTEILTKYPTRVGEFLAKLLLGVDTLNYLLVVYLVDNT